MQVDVLRLRKSEKILSLSSHLIAVWMGIVFQVTIIFPLEFLRHFFTVSCLLMLLLRSLILVLSLYLPMSLFPQCSEISP